MCLTVLVLKPNTRQCSTSSAAAAGAGVQQKHSRPAAAVSKPQSHMDHLADRVSTDFSVLYIL